jgi:hypothetical protein
MKDNLKYFPNCLLKLFVTLVFWHQIAFMKFCKHKLYVYTQFYHIFNNM